MYQHGVVRVRPEVLSRFFDKEACLERAERTQAWDGSNENSLAPMHSANAATPAARPTPQEVGWACTTNARGRSAREGA